MNITVSSFISSAALLFSSIALAAPLLPGDATGLVYLSGNRASAGFIKNNMIDKVCRSSSAREITVYQYNDFEYTIICDLDPATGVNGTVLATKQSGSSSDGTTPVSNPANNAIAYRLPPFNLVVASTVCNGPLSRSTANGTQFILYTDCSTGSANRSGADIGASDVEPALFYDINTPESGHAFPQSDLDKIRMRPFANLVFGVAVTTKLRNALQAWQFPDSSPCHPSHSDHNTLMPKTINGVLYDVGRIEVGTFNQTATVSSSLGRATVADSAQCMPNLRQVEVAGLFTGKLTNWTQLRRGGRNLVQAAQAAGLTVPNASAPLNNQRVHICRRVTGSGTNAQFQAYYLNRPCAKDISNTPVGNSMLLPDTAQLGNFFGAQVVLSNRTGSDLGRCLDDLDNAAVSSSSTYFKPGGTPLDDSRYAWGIGYQSTQKNMDLGRDWRFIRVNGHEPTLQAAYRGDYLNAYEATCQINTADVGPGDFVMANAIFDEVCTADPLSVFNENRNFLHAFGSAGWLSIPDDDASGNNEAPDDEFELMNPDSPIPVARWTRGSSNCAAPIVIDQ